MTSYRFILPARIIRTAQTALMMATAIFDWIVKYIKTRLPPMKTRLPALALRKTPRPADTITMHLRRYEIHLPGAGITVSREYRSLLIATSGSDDPVSETKQLRCLLHTFRYLYAKRTS